MDTSAFLVRIVAALGMGMVIGLERQWRQHPAGLRTNTLVCVGAALFVSLDLMLEGNTTQTRIAAQVVSGIGFLCGGVILREGFNVRGMNTAATLWCSAAIGSLIGAGHLVAGGIGSVTILFVHLAMRPLVRHLTVLPFHAEGESIYRLHVICSPADNERLRKMLIDEMAHQSKFALQRLASQLPDPAGHAAIIAEIYASEGNDAYINDLATRLGRETGVTSVSWEKLQLHLINN